MINKSPTEKAPPKKTAKTYKKKNASSTKTPEPSVTILQTAKCQSLTNKSNLTYNIGVDDVGGIFIRVNGNTGGEFFSREWVALDTIESALSALPEDNPISSFSLAPLFTNQSANNPGFMAAVLLKEDLLKQLPGKKRHYAFSGTDAFLAKVDKLRSAKKAK